MLERPPNIPAHAEHIANRKVWRAGAKDADGKEDGLWQWFTEAGILTGERSYKNGAPKTDRNFYPDGTLSRTAAYDPRGVCIEQSLFVHPERKWLDLLQEDLTIKTDTLPESAVEIRKIPNKYPTSYEFFDAKGELISLKKKRPPKKKK